MTKAEMGRRAYAFAKVCIENFKGAASSLSFCVFELLAACLFVGFRSEVLGAAFFVALIGLKLLFCEDVLATTFPFLIVCTITTNCYDSFDLFFPYIIYAPIVVVCLLYHFIVYKKPIGGGESVRGIFAVSIAVMLGGLGRYSVIDYVYGAYYIFGLGFGMLAAYYLMKSRFSVRRDCDLKERFSWIMTFLGILCVFMIAFGYFKFHILKWTPNLVPYSFSRNNLSTLLMFAMPFPLYLAHKRKYLAALSLVFYAAIAVTTSRGGLIFGGIELVLCAVYWVLTGTHRKIRLFICLGAAAVFLLVFGSFILEWVLHRIYGEQEGDIANEARWVMIWQSFENFKNRPLSGNGIMDPDLWYSQFKKKGSMAWYHMMVPQIYGSMGLIGVAAYLLQGIDRLKLIFKKSCKWSLCLGLSYAGILLMSQVNPGEFCPMPFELLTVLLFIFQEERFIRHPLYR